MAGCIVIVSSDHSAGNYGLFSAVISDETDVARIYNIVELDEKLRAAKARGDELRSKGIRIESLAIVDSMTDDSLEFRH